MLLYQQGFRYFNMGYASAMAMLLLVVALAVTLADPAQLAPLGPLPGAGPVSTEAARRAAAAPGASSAAARRSRFAASGS